MKNTNLVRAVAVIMLLSVIFGGTVAYAASETETAAAYLVERGILAGDENGDLMLDKTLTRAELAVILTRLDFVDTPGGLAEWRDWGEANFANPDNRYNKFTDLPNWALPYIEYCFQRSLMNGVAEAKFDPDGKVNPRMACTVILRYCGVAETDWNYNTSVEKAQALGLTPATGLDGDVILRGAMAAVIYRGMNYDNSQPAPQETPTVTPPQETPTQTPPLTATDMTIDEMKAEVVRLTNEERAKVGLPALEVLPALMDCAQLKAQDMVDNGYYGHTSPVYGTANEMIRALVPGYNGALENSGIGARNAIEVVEGWVYSEGHYTNIKDTRPKYIGIGIVENKHGVLMWVQQFMW